MAEHGDRSLTRRGAWIGLRTLRQRPKVVDHTDSGDPVFEVRSVRLVLRADADHFNRLERCSKCGRDVPGAAVRELTDLDAPSNPLICTGCVRRVAGAASLRPRVARRAEPPDPVASPEGEAGAAAAVVDTKVDAGRLTALEGRYEGVASRLTELADVQRSESIEGRQAGDAAGSRLEATVAEVRAAVAASAEVAAAGVRALEDNVRQSLQGITELLRAQQSEIAALSGTLAETRGELRKVTESHGELLRAQHELDRRVVEMAGRISGQPPAPAEALQRRIEELGAALARSVDGQRAELHAAVAEGLAQRRAELESLEGQLRANATALTRMVETQRDDLESALANGVRAEVAGVAQAVGDLRASSGATATRLEALERRLERAMERLAALVEHPRLEPATAMPTRTSGAAGSELLDALDRQLQEAEGRLLRLAVPSAGDEG